MTLFLSKYKDHELVEQRTFDRIKREKRMILDSYNTFNFYLTPALLTIIIPIAIFYTDIKFVYKITFLPLLIAAGVFILNKQKSDLKFKRFAVKYTPARFKALADRAKRQLCWDIDYCDSDLFRAYYHIPLLVRPTMITALRDTDDVLINCISYPYSMFSSKYDACTMNIEDLTKLMGIGAKPFAKKRKRRKSRKK